MLRHCPPSLKSSNIIYLLTSYLEISQMCPIQEGCFGSRETEEKSLKTAFLASELDKQIKNLGHAI